MTNAIITLRRLGRRIQELVETDEPTGPFGLYFTLSLLSKEDVDLLGEIERHYGENRYEHWLALLLEGTTMFDKETAQHAVLLPPPPEVA